MLGFGQVVTVIPKQINPPDISLSWLSRDLVSAVRANRVMVSFGPLSPVRLLHRCGISWLVAHASRLFSSLHYIRFKFVLLFVSPLPFLSLCLILIRFTDGNIDRGWQSALQPADLVHALPIPSAGWSAWSTTDPSWCSLIFHACSWTVAPGPSPISRKNDLQVEVQSQ